LRGCQCQHGAVQPATDDDDICLFHTLTYGCARGIVHAVRGR
jgi:hypothetical protein